MLKKSNFFKPSYLGAISSLTIIILHSFFEPKLFSNDNDPAIDTTSDYKKKFCRAKNAKIRENLAQSTNLHLDDGTAKNTDNPKIFLEISYGGTPSEIRNMSPEDNPVCWGADTYFFEYNAAKDHHCMNGQKELNELLALFNLPAQLQVIEGSGTIHSLVTASDRKGLDICATTKIVTPLISNNAQQP